MNGIINPQSPDSNQRDQQQDAAIKGLASAVQVLVQHLKKVEVDIEEIKKQLVKKPRKPRAKKVELLQEQVDSNPKE
jgi:hypothetical protein